jgi:prepilin-type N-terminal cleavage/methylation domain-containing protein
MKTPRNTPSTAHAFTLIELLTVIAIIAILMGLLFPVMGVVKETAKKTQAKNEVVQIVSAVKLYYTEYGKYPIDTSAGGNQDAFYGGGTPPSGASTATNDKLFDVLRNNTTSANNALVTTLNPRGISYIEAPTVKSTSKPIAGVIPPNAANLPAGLLAGEWVDPWGSQYNVCIDGNYNNVVAAPAYTDLSTNYVTSGSDTGVSTGVIVWSFGRNGMLGGDGAGATIPTGFTKEGGTANQLSGSGDVVSWQ